ncbi:MAG: hypothetical protein RRY64_00350 [Oscillospiraceae bacterium]
MNERISYSLKMELLSDAILGSGYSIPGGEDIAVRKDKLGFPRMAGATLKGLLRESLENYLVWTGGNADTLIALLGEEGRSDTDESRKLRMTDLTLENPPKLPDDCYGLRSFTAMENGLAKEGSLRSAACLRRGLCLAGTLSCSSADASLAQAAVENLKWVGTLRNRGFGAVRCSLEPLQSAKNLETVTPGNCLRYRLELCTPMCVTNLAQSYANGYETRGYLPGSAVRGMVLSALVAAEPMEFATRKSVLLSDAVRFTNALPLCGDQGGIPPPKGFYENKQGGDFESVLLRGTVTPGNKRASLGNICRIEGDKLRCTSAQTGGDMRITRKNRDQDQGMYTARYLAAGQMLEGYIYCDNPDLAPLLGGTFHHEIWLGADRSCGCGLCRLVALEVISQPDYLQWSYAPTDEIPAQLTMELLAPTAMRGENGNPVGLDEKTLATALGVETVRVDACATSLVEVGGFNRTWGCAVPALTMYDGGSTFLLTCTPPPTFAALRRLELSGLGLRRSEGCGQVLFLRNLAGIRGHSTELNGAAHDETPAVLLRRARCRWLLDNVARIQQLTHLPNVRERISNSQLGSIQALCEEGIAKGGDKSALLKFFEHNETERGAQHGDKFASVRRELAPIWERSLGETLGVPCTDTDAGRLLLLCDLLDLSRKEAGK